MRLLVYDPDVSGHHVEYLRHVVHYFLEHRSVDRLICVVNPGLVDRDPELAETMRLEEAVRLLELTHHEVTILQESSTLIARSLREWKIVEHYAEESRADHALLMNLNPLQFALGAPRARTTPLKVSGILFNPFVRIRVDGAYSLEGVGTRLRRIRKKLLLGWALRNDRVHRIFVLNDREGARELNELYGRENTFQELADPVLSPIRDERTEADLRQQYGLTSTRTVFLLFGSLSRRKGVLKLLEALAYLRTDEAASMVLLLLGKLASDLEETVPREVEKRERELPELRIVLDDRFLDTDEMFASFGIADVILAPYQRGTEGSSGILGHAAAARKPVIGPRDGLIGSLIGRYELGARVNVRSERELAAALARYTAMPTSVTESEGRERYVAERTPTHFSQQILGSLS